MLRFAYRLAARLGYVSVRRMLSEITWQELQEWVAFDELEPGGEWREDARLAILRATIFDAVQAGVGGKGRKRPHDPNNFLPLFGDAVKTKPKQTWQQQEAILRKFAQLAESEGKPRSRGRS